MRRQALSITLVLATVVLALATAASGAPARNACTAGESTIGGVKYETFCGPAKASVKTGGKTLTFTNGACVTTSSYFTINVGATQLLATGKPVKAYFGLDVGKVPGGEEFGGRAAGGDGTYANVPVSFVSSTGTKYLALGATVKLTNGRKDGSFSGKLLTGGSASGTFSC